MTTTTEKKIKESITWEAEAVRSMCVWYNWYDAGNSAQYNAMLNFVTNHKPTTQNIYKVACDIIEHSTEEGLYIEAVMFLIHKDCINHFYTVREKEEKE